ncbi:hypothetical protein IG626_08425 [Desulfovibrio desulfuricans]|uniref:hypothetical protein n=1 Tax=Desulfovibrio desulfuricans TaxID=876 RepID=UPI0017831DDB|nr:hypothetical protein [Desulfovibrio desulfuricans]MBD8896026.1 hypothetical protein [Desulfovibrio desulfuricans]
MSENLTRDESTVDAPSASCGGCRATGAAADPEASWKKIAGTLTGEEMKKYSIFRSPRQCEEIPDKKYQATTFDLRLGEGHYLYDGADATGRRKWRCVYIGEEERFQELNNNPGSEKFDRPDSDRPNTLLIPAFSSALIQLYEVVDTLTVAQREGILVVGRFDLKLSRVHQGLISQQATQVEPCYCGRLFCFLHNLSNKSIELKYKDAIATIEFSYVSCAHNSVDVNKVVDDLVAHNSSEERYNKAYCDGKGITDVRYFWADERLPEECGLWSLRDTLTKGMESDAAVDKLAALVAPKIDKKNSYFVAAIQAVGVLGAAAIAGWFGVQNVLTSNETKLNQVKIEWSAKLEKQEQNLKASIPKQPDLAPIIKDISEIRKELDVVRSKLTSPSELSSANGTHGDLR